MTDAIAWALVHFLWQGAALALVAAVLMRIASSASVRYTIGVATMTAMVMGVAMTAAMAITADTVQRTNTPTVQESSGPEVQGATGLARRSLGEGGSTGPGVQSLPTVWILTLWIIGVVALSIRAFGGWWVARRVARDAIMPLPEALQAVARALAQRLGIRRVVGVFQSSRVSVPVMIGWLRPVVIMPPATLSGLSIAQVEAIFAHEFAHIRRHDYLVNLVQTAVETALFYHPAVWWLSRAIRRERELCCDDLAVSVSDRLTYATALSALAHLQPPSLALAATDGSLRDRVRRIITNSPTSDSAKGGWMAMLPLLLVASLAAPSAFTQINIAAPAQRTGDVVETRETDRVPPSDRTAGVTSAPSEPKTTPNVAPTKPSARVAPPVLLALPLVSNYTLAATSAMELQPPPPQVSSALRAEFGNVVSLTWTHVAGADSDMNRRYPIAADGTITVKYLGFIHVAGKAPAEIQQMLISGMTEKAIYPPGVISVVATVLPDDRRFVIIAGRVQSPGEKRLFPEQMTVIKAIAASGGLLPSAGDIEIRRPGVDQAINITGTQLQAGADLNLVDGDTLIVRQALVFFVNGEVLTPGQKVWRPGLTVLQAVALAGGLTPKGRLSHIMRPVKDANGKILKYEKIKNIKNQTEILPDDQLVIVAKWFGE